MGHVEEGLETLTRAVEHLSRHHGDESHHTAYARLRLARATEDMGRLGEAIDLYRLARGQLEASLGAEHGQTIHARESLARALARSSKRS